MLRLACVFTLVVACTKTSETTHPATTIAPADAASGDASVPAATPAVLASCPKTYPIAAAGTCSLASVGKLECTYPDGHCSCETFRPCSGWSGAYEEASRHPRAKWDCTPKVRPDGCLGDMPAIDSSCAQNGKECSYASCGGDVLACRGNTWELARRISPPP